jgi:hypothetical protein
MEVPEHVKDWDWVWQHFGVAGVIAVTCGVVWWQWKDIRELPGIKRLVAGITKKALPKAVPGKFNIAIAHLEGDDKQEMERLIRESVVEFPSVATLSFDRLIVSEQGNAEQAEREGHERARTLLKESGADVLIWGIVIKGVEKSVPKLYWTPARDIGAQPTAGRYQAAEDLRLPQVFWLDLTKVLGLLVANRNAAFLAQDGHFQADQLDPFIVRMRTLLASSNAQQWNAATRTQVLVILARSCVFRGR